MRTPVKLLILNRTKLLSVSNNLHSREGHEVFSAVTGGRPLFFSRRINGGSRSPEPFDVAHGPEPFDRLRPRAPSRGKIEGPVEGNAEGVRIPR
jgi:hypothetical protein